MTRTAGPPISALLRPATGDGRLAAAELTAAVLDGDLVRVGDAFVPIDAPQDPELRAAVLLPRLVPGLVVAGRTAAWVWGAAWHLEEPISCCHGRSLRPAPAPGLAIQRVVLRPGDVVAVGDARVTSPLRTSLDLARAAEADYDERLLARQLRRSGLTTADVIAELERRPRVPRRRAALQRLQVLLTR